MAYSVSHTQDWLEIRLSGDTSLEELMQVTSELVGDSPEPQACLVDATDLDSAEIDYEAVTRLFEHRDHMPMPDRGSWIAIVAQKPHLYGMARMIELRTTDHERMARAFHERSEAEAWLASRPRRPTRSPANTP